MWERIDFAIFREVVDATTILLYFTTVLFLIAATYEEWCRLLYK